MFTGLVEDLGSVEAVEHSGDGVVLSARFKALAAGDTNIGQSSAQALGLGGVLPAPALPPAWVVHVQ